MTTEDLLIPRYKVIAPWPDIDKWGLAVPDIITFDKYDKFSNQWYNEGKESNIYDAFYDNYPHLFRKLEWQEDRKPEDMPEYVKGVGGYFNNKIYKVAHPSQNGREWHIDNEIEHQAFVRYANDFLPSTLEEYTSFINNQKK